MNNTEIFPPNNIPIPDSIMIEIHHQCSLYTYDRRHFFCSYRPAVDRSNIVPFPEIYHSSVVHPFLLWSQYHLPFVVSIHHRKFLDFASIAVVDVVVVR